MQANLDDARGLTFQCRDGCGFCCTASPLVLPAEAGPLGSLVQRREDGTLRIPVKGVQCSMLQADRRCGTYGARPGVCRVYPYQVHAGRRVQAVVTLACPGIAPLAGEGEDMAAAAGDVVERVLAAPGAADMAAEARDTFRELDRRMQEWGHAATADKLRSAFGPSLARLADPVMLPAFFTGLGEGDLVLEGKAARAVEALFEVEPAADLEDLLAEAAREAFAENQDALWVEPGFAWSVPRFRNGRVRLERSGGDDRTPFEADPAEVPTAWTPGAIQVLHAYLERLTRRDHTEGAALWLVDASGYQVTPAAAYGRVLAEASLQVMLRAGLAALEEDAHEVTPALAQRGVAAYETSYHSLPTLGCIL